MCLLPVSFSLQRKFKKVHAAMDVQSRLHLGVASAQTTTFESLDKSRTRRFHGFLESNWSTISHRSHQTISRGGAIRTAEP
jgi:hypothetical protein